MQPRKIGNIEVSPTGFGGWAIGGPFTNDAGDPLGWGQIDDRESITAIRTAFDAGITLFDTANVYGAGHSERVLARALAGHRDEVVLATKWGNTMVEATRVLDGSDGSVENMRESLRGSLSRLETDHVDLFQFHLNDYAGPEVDDLRAALEDLVAAGLIRAYGWSTDHPDRARCWLGGEHFKAVQTEINVLNDNPGVIAVAEQHGLACLNRGPLAMGLLTGKYLPGTAIGPEDVRGSSPEWMHYFEDGRPSAGYLESLGNVRDILMSGGRSLVQGAIAWLWARSEANIPIPGIRTEAQASENAGAMEHGPLEPAQVEEIESLLGRG
jgi:aryl-alcohol dehydrogenase-like predicted oxidoreductase